MASLVMSAPFAPVPDDVTQVLIFSKTAGYRHDSIEVGTKTLEELGRKHGLVMAHTEDAAMFTPEKLEKYSAVIFLSTTGDVFNEEQQKAFSDFIKKGRGYMGIHAAADTEYEWPWYGKLVGGYFLSHPAIQKATVKVVDHKHPSTAHLPEDWSRTDEWYDYKELPPTGARILCKMDTTTYQGHKMGENHPITWCQEIEGTRSFYTGMGHTKESYADPAFQKHLEGGLLWVVRMANDVKPSW